MNNMKKSSKISVTSLHSFKGGVGKTTLALMLADYLARDEECALGENGAICFVNLDLYGTYLVNLTKDGPGDLIGPLLKHDRAKKDGFPDVVRAAKIMIVRWVIASKGVPEEFALAYLGLSREAVLDFVPHALGGWQCEYLAHRLLDLFAYIADKGCTLWLIDRRTGRPINSTPSQCTPRCFIIDNAPGMHGLSLSVFNHVAGRSEEKAIPSNWLRRAVTVLTPQSTDIQAACDWRQQGDRDSEEPNVVSVMNRATSEFKGIIDRNEHLLGRRDVIPARVPSSEESLIAPPSKEDQPLAKPAKESIREPKRIEKDVLVNAARSIYTPIPLSQIHPCLDSSIPFDSEIMSSANAHVDRDGVLLLGPRVICRPAYDSELAKLWPGSSD